MDKYYFQAISPDWGIKHYRNLGLIMYSNLQFQSQVLILF